MSAATSPLPARVAEASFLDSTLGKKVIMAATGVILFGFVIGHMLGNLQIYLGPEKLNAYAEMLRNNPGLVWGTRIVLLVSVVLHITMAVQLTLLKGKARPIAYAKTASVSSTYASRTMMWSGPILFAFIIYHLLHFTAGSVHPSFSHTDVYHNVVVGFQQPAVAIAYIIAMAMLAMHLYHGAWSMFQSLGIAHPRYTPLLKKLALGAAVALGAGNISIPVSVLSGLVK